MTTYQQLSTGALELIESSREAAYDEALAKATGYDGPEAEAALDALDTSLWEVSWELIARRWPR